MAWLHARTALRFFIFTDYAKPSMRLSALMELPVIYVFTHDSIGLGEDGPTHQAVEQLAALRAMPGMYIIRPGDANEVLEAYRFVIRLKHKPASIVLSRQALPTVDRSKFAAATGLEKGAYVLADSPGGAPDAILMASGSEVSICMQARELLEKEEIKTRVVSFPCFELFEEQPQSYRDSVLPPSVRARVAVEAAAPLGWDQFIGPSGAMIGMRTFGTSAPAKDAFKRFGFTPENVVSKVKAQLGKS